MNLLGAELGDDLIEGLGDNPKGFWELKPMVHAHMELMHHLGSGWDDIAPLPTNWLEQADTHKTTLQNILTEHFKEAPLFALKDPRMCRLLPLWQQLLNDKKITYLLCLRHPDEVAASIAKRNGYAHDKGLWIWLRYMVDMLVELPDENIKCLHYPDLLDDWQKAIDALGMEWPNSTNSIASDVESFLESGLKHHAASKVSTDNIELKHWCESIFEAVKKEEFAKAKSTAQEIKPAMDAQCLHTRLLYQEILQLRDAIEEAKLALTRTNIALEEAKLALTRTNIALEEANTLVTQKDAQIEEFRGIMTEQQTALDDHHVALEAERQQVAEYKEILDALYNSTSWKVTEPLRYVTTKIKGSN
jgi:hypothetical protein